MDLDSIFGNTSSKGTEDNALSCFSRPNKKFKCVEVKQEKSSLKEFKSLKDEETNETKPASDEKTIFVGNVDKTVNKIMIKKLFRQFGKIESIRLRGIVPVKPNIMKKVAYLNDKMNPDMKTVIYFVRFSEAADAEDALSLNGTLFNGRHIRVDRTLGSSKKLNEKNSIFLGNLPFDVDEEIIHEKFSAYGQVKNVRVVRDKHSGQGKGFGYVLFESSGAVNLALMDKDVEIDGRKIRIKAVEKTPTRKKTKPKKLQEVYFSSGTVDSKSKKEHKIKKHKNNRKIKGKKCNLKSKSRKMKTSLRRKDKCIPEL